MRKWSATKLPSFRFIAVPLWLSDEESSGLALDGDHDPCRRSGSNQNNQQEIILPHFYSIGYIVVQTCHPDPSMTYPKQLTCLLAVLGQVDAMRKSAHLSNLSSLAGGNDELQAGLSACFTVCLPCFGLPCFV